MTLFQTRFDQMFPVLDAAQIETARRFASGPARDFAAGEIVFEIGDRNAPAWLVLKGTIDVVRRDGLNHEAAITAHRPRAILGRAQPARRARRARPPAMRGPRAAPRCLSTPRICAR